MTTKRDPYQMTSAEYAERIQIERRHDAAAFDLGVLALRRLRDYPIGVWVEADDLSPVDDPDARRCQECGDIYERKIGERGATWALRKYCGDACKKAGQLAAYRKNRERLRAARAVGGPDDRICQECGDIYERKIGERGATWASRKYCGDACKKAGQLAAYRKNRERLRAARAVGGPDDRICQECGEIFQLPDRVDKRGRSRAIYCSETCRGIRMRRHNQKWTAIRRQNRKAQK